MPRKHTCDACGELLDRWWNVQAYPSTGYDIDGYNGERVRWCHGCALPLFAKIMELQKELTNAD